MWGFQRESSRFYLVFGISYSGSTRPWGGCSPGSIPGIPTRKKISPGRRDFFVLTMLEEGLRLFPILEKVTDFGEEEFFLGRY